MSRLVYPETIDASSDFVKFEFYEYDTPYKGGAAGTGNQVGTDYYVTKSLTKKGSPIYLPMPDEIGSSFGGNWSGKDVTGLAQVALGTVGKTVGGIITGKGDQALGGIANIFTADTLKAGIGGATADVITLLGQKFQEAPGLGANLGANDILQLTTGTIINPNTELLYGGTGLRTHGYTFRMIAQSKTEATSILNIVNEFKKACAPKQKSAVLGNFTRNFIAVPDLCQITFCKAGGSENDNLPKYKVSGITSVNVGYITDGKYIAFTGGEPIGVTLSLSLIETKLVFREDIEGGSAR
jgi:hypothetical protein